MFIGFDYGTANCSVASMQDGNPVLIPLEGDSLYIPSTLAAPTRESVSEHLFRHRHIAQRMHSVSNFCVVRWRLIVKKASIYSLLM